ncbi:hypothetical protein H0A65_12700 [Alcaligenaceae bacterium]|nr:hypothetical protein [Alcaligenaceae bacterium]
MLPWVGGGSPANGVLISASASSRWASGELPSLRSGQTTPDDSPHLPFVSTRRTPNRQATPTHPGQLRHADDLPRLIEPYGANGG